MCDADELARDPQERIAELLSANVSFERRARDAEGANRNVRAALAKAITENVWNAYYTGIVQNDTWYSAGMSDAEWLCRELGLPPGRHPDEEVTKKFPALVERLVARAEAGES
jgi:hypothetical protein